MVLPLLGGTSASFRSISWLRVVGAVLPSMLLLLFPLFGSANTALKGLGVLLVITACILLGLGIRHSHKNVLQYVLGDKAQLKQILFGNCLKQACAV